MAYKPLTDINQFNKDFQTNNPQYFTQPKTSGTIAPQAMSQVKTGQYLNPAQTNLMKPPQVKPINEYNPMGTPAKSPQTNIAPQNNSINSNQANTNVAGASNKGIMNPYQNQGASANQSFPGLIGSLANLGQSESPEVAKAREDLLNFEKEHANYINGVQSMPNPFGFYTGVGQLAENRYSTQLPAYQQAVSNALSSQGQRIGALGTAASQASPQQVSPGNFYVNPQSGQDVSGGEINPGTGGARQAQVALGQMGQSNIPKINSAAESVNNVNQILRSGNFNQNDLNVFNLINNIASSNTSNPEYPKLQAAFNNAVNQYAGVLGQDPNQLISTLASTGKATTVAGALNNLDQMAKSYNRNIINASYSQNPATTNIQQFQPQTQSVPQAGHTGTTSGGNTYTVTQS